MHKIITWYYENSTSPTRHLLNIVVGGVSLVTGIGVALGTITGFGFLIKMILSIIFPGVHLGIGDIIGFTLFGSVAIALACVVTGFLGWALMLGAQSFFMSIAAKHRQKFTG